MIGDDSGHAVHLHRQEQYNDAMNIFATLARRQTKR